MSNKKQTAVEELIEKLKQYDAGVLLLKLHKEEIEQANKMFKQQIIEAFEEGCENWDSEQTAQQYYNETFNK
jgi:hypothetical protein